MPCAAGKLVASGGCNGEKIVASKYMVQCTLGQRLLAARRSSITVTPEDFVAGMQEAPKLFHCTWLGAHAESIKKKSHSLSLSRAWLYRCHRRAIFVV